MEIKVLENTLKEIKEITALLQQVFPKASHFTEDFIKWLYVDNPAGKAVGFNAYEGSLLIGHYVTVPIVANVFGKQTKGVLSLNTATHPDHGGKGIFTKLAKETYAEAHRRGSEFVIGVANQNSSHGFEKKLGFQLVAPLDVRIGFGTIEKPRTSAEEEKNFEFERLWPEEHWQWRVRNPSAQYGCVVTKLGQEQWLAKTTVPSLRAVLAAREQNSSVVNSRGFGVIRPRVWLGTDPLINWKRGLWVNLPMKLRPSPLNLIFLDLSGKGRKLEKSRVRFWTADFDAY